MKIRSLLANKSTKFIAISGLAVVAWFALAEVSTEAWYRYKESQVPETQPWNIQFPDPNDPMAAAEKGFFNFQTREMTDAEFETLRISDGKALNWQDSEGDRWSAFYLQWEADDRKNQMDITHNPTICLPAAGFRLLGEEETFELNVNGTKLNVRPWIFDVNGQKVYTFMASRWGRSFPAVGYERGAIAQRKGHFQKVALGNRGNVLETLQVFIIGPNSFDAARSELQERLSVILR